MKISDKLRQLHFSTKIRKRKLAVGAFFAAMLLVFGMTVLFCRVPLTQDQRFRAFTKQVFLSELSGSTLNLHYTLADPSAYGLKNYPITLGNMGKESQLASAAQVENYLSTLETFSRDQLSAGNRLTYDILSEYLNTSKEMAPYYLYSEPLSPTLGIQAQLPVLLAEYTFRTKQDIEDYLQLLTTIPDYFQSILDFELEKAKKGLFMSDICAKDVLSQCNSFVNSEEENYLKQLFDEQIDSFTNLTADEKISYKKQNEEIINAYVLPAYQNLMTELAKLLGSGKNSGGLCGLPQGKSYYECLVHSVTGDFSSLEAIEARIKKEITQVYSQIQTLLQPGSGLTSVSLDDLPAQEPADILNHLQDIISQDFPEAPQVSCQVKYVHDSLADYLSPAFYLIPPIDDMTSNVIYINPANDYNPLELYTTLAHEGYPGHLYQTVSFEAANQEPLRSILSYGGYTEGWATYVEMYAYSTWEENPQLASLYQKDRSFLLGIASLLDIGIHYRGYTRNQVKQFLAKFGIQEETADSLYTAILESPANYLKYYVGYLNFQDLQTYLKGVLGKNFSLKEYHARVLQIGPCSFRLLKNYLTDEEYLQSLSASSK
ncbi:MAG: DUF885 domain-containing protein [Lachnospiraceae bacterium]|nr:DUF885 domain-containing protein [Lachnospiraceae bacterium]